MANQKKNARLERLKQLKLEELALKEQNKIEEDFITGGFKNINDPEAKVPNKEKYPHPEATVIHDISGIIFDTTLFTEDELENLFFEIQSAIYQIKFTTKGNLSEEKAEECNSMLETLISLRTNLSSYYNSMAKVMRNDQNNKGKKKDGRKIGGIGVSRQMF